MTVSAAGTLTRSAAQSAQMRAAQMRAPADRPRSRTGEARAALSRVEMVRAEGAPVASGFVGYASITETPYTMYDFFGDYTEVVSSGAFARTLAAEPQVELVVNHGRGGQIPMAHTRNGTLRLTEDDEGLRVEADLDESRNDVHDVLSALERGDLAEMSFRFMIDAGQWSPDYTEFRINAVDIDRGDVSVVNFGANPHTHIDSARSDAVAVPLARDESSAAEAMGDDLPAEQTTPTQEREATVPTTPVELAAPVAEPNSAEEALRARVELLEEQLRTRSNADTVAHAPAYDQVARVGSEARTYNPGRDREGVSFLRDFASSVMGDYAAQMRLSQHMQEERAERGHQLRDVGTSAFSGLTVPQYLVDLVAPLARAGRPLADNCRGLTLPADGMTVNISRITTGTATAVQAAEAGAVQETDIDDTTLTVSVRTIAGQQDVSFQALARSVGTEQVILEDLVRAYHTTLDSQIINGDGNSGTHLGIRSIASISTATITDSTPTPAEAIGSLYALQSTIESAVFMNATHLVMAPRRWHWFRSAIGTDVALIGQGSAYPPQTLGVVNGNSYGAGVRGDLAGLPVIVDGNIPLTVSSDQDVILAVNVNELFLWEQAGAPLYIRAQQPGAGNLMEKLVIYGFSAFTGGRYPAAHGVASGTGLAAPTVFGKAIS